MKGSSTINHQGDYNRVESQIPAARSFAVGWFDSHLLMFGGQTSIQEARERK